MAISGRRAGLAITVVLGLLVAGFAIASRESSVQAYATETMQNRDRNSDRITLYQSLEEALPNVTFTTGPESFPAASQLVVRADIVDVQKGKGFWIPGDDAERGTVIEFDDSRALWQTVHLTVAVSEMVAGEPPSSSSLDVGVAIDPSVDFERFADGLLELDDVVLFLTKRTGVFDYEPDRFGIVEDGALLLSVDRDGKLELPFMAQERRERLTPLPSLEALKRAAHQPATVGVSERRRLSQ